MIEHTFQMLPSVGKKKETALWESGVRDWDEFLSSESVAGIKSKDRCDAIVMQAAVLLDDGEASLLGDIIPRGEHWRMFDRFKNDAAYLDIETDGLSRDSLVTVVTVHRKKSHLVAQFLTVDLVNTADSTGSYKTFNTPFSEQRLEFSDDFHIILLVSLFFKITWILRWLYIERGLRR